MRKDKTAVIAIGGNAITGPGDSGTTQEQYRNIYNCCGVLVQLIRAGYRLVLTHGNGPQVGAMMLQSESACQQVPPLPLDVLDAATQGTLGYLISSALEKKLREEGLNVPVAALLTKVEVRENDDAFSRPSKPIGPFYSEQQIPILERRGYSLVADSGRGYRIIVPSPQPVSVLERGAIQTLVESGWVVIAGGGGGIPVTVRGSELHGESAVIDKDLASAVIALEIKADIFAIVTGVDCVYRNYEAPQREKITRMTVAQAQSMLVEGEFAAGSMKPKIEAACRFASESGHEAVITSIQMLDDALFGSAGTRIVPDRAAE